jgi:RHS repeat-associated protein
MRQSQHILQSFGMGMFGRSSGNEYAISFNGKRDDANDGWQIQDYGFRTYDYRLGRFLSEDPLKSCFPFYSPYQFSGNTPIQANDIDGLEPNGVVTKLTDGTFKFTEPAIHLLSLVSGVESDILRNTKVNQSSIAYLGVPWYDNNEGGGAITWTGNITLTKNFFSTCYQHYGFKYTNKYVKSNFWKDKYQFVSTSYGFNNNSSVQHWLSLNAHEVKHLKQAKDYGANSEYFAAISMDYLKSFEHEIDGDNVTKGDLGKRTHDGAYLEKDAEKGRDLYDNFNTHVKAKYGGKDVIGAIFNSSLSDKAKINIIDFLFKDFAKANNIQLPNNSNNNDTNIENKSDEDCSNDGCSE